MRSDPQARVPATTSVEVRHGCREPALGGLEKSSISRYMNSNAVVFEPPSNAAQMGNG